MRLTPRLLRLKSSHCLQVFEEVSCQDSSERTLNIEQKRGFPNIHHVVRSQDVTRTLFEMKSYLYIVGIFKLIIFWEKGKQFVFLCFYNLRLAIVWCSLVLCVDVSGILPWYHLVPIAVTLKVSCKIEVRHAVALKNRPKWCFSIKSMLLLQNYLFTKKFTSLKDVKHINDF